MANNIKKSFVSASLLIALSSIACSTSGPVYQKAKTIPAGYGLVYIYRPAKFDGFGVAPNLYTRQGQTFINKIYNGGYLPYFSKPGKIYFSAVTETESLVSIDVNAGETYFIKMTISTGSLVGRPHLEVISAGQGEKEIKNCTLISKGQN